MIENLHVPDQDVLEDLVRVHVFELDHALVVDHLAGPGADHPQFEGQITVRVRGESHLF